MIDAKKSGDKPIGVAPLLIILFYVIAAFISASISTCYGIDNIPFGYSFYFSCAEILSYFFYPAVQAIMLILGYLVSKRIFRLRFKLSASHKLPRLNLRIKHFWLLTFMTTVIITVFLLFTALTYQNYADPDNWRAISSKSSQFLLVLSGYTISMNVVMRRLALPSVVLLLVIGGTVLLADASRAAAVPFAVLVFFSLLNRRFLIALFAALLILPILGFAHSAREFFAFGQRGTYELTLILSNFELFDVGYLAAYSFVHMLAVQDATHLSFTIRDLFYSIIPLPSRLHFIDHNLEDWRLDMFRPMSAVSQILHLGMIPFVVFNFLVGIFFKRVSLLSRNSYGVLSAVFLILFVLAGHQYMLRGAMWFFYLHLFLSFFSARAGLKRVVA